MFPFSRSPRHVMVLLVYVLIWMLFFLFFPPLSVTEFNLVFSSIFGSYCELITINFSS